MMRRPPSSALFPFTPLSRSNRGGDLGDVTHLPGQVARHRIDVIGQVFPDARYTLDFGLPAELALGASSEERRVGYGGRSRWSPDHYKKSILEFENFTLHIDGERVELVNHDIERILEFEDFALHMDGDLLGQVAVGNRGGDLGDVTHLPGQVACHRIDVIGQVLPDTCYTLDFGLPAELALGADFTRHTRYFRRERAQLLDHDVERVLYFQNLT